MSYVVAGSHLSLRLSDTSRGTTPASDRLRGAESPSHEDLLTYALHAGGLGGHRRSAHRASNPHRGSLGAGGLDKAALVGHGR